MPNLVQQCIPVPKGWAQVKAVYGDFKYTELSKGLVDIDDTWERENLVTVKNLPGTTQKLQLHHLVVPIFQVCFAEAVRRCPNYKVLQLGGHCARHQHNDPKLPLSLHSWGCAFDINWNTNPMTTKKQGLITDLPKEFIAAFTEQGWEWGGAWSSLYDAMHFQYATGV